jgi:hypothetical protein
MPATERGVERRQRVRSHAVDSNGGRRTRDEVMAETMVEQDVGLLRQPGAPAARWERTVTVTRGASLTAHASSRGAERKQTAKSSG